MGKSGAENQLPKSVDGPLWCNAGNLLGNPAAKPDQTDPVTFAVAAPKKSARLQPKPCRLKLHLMCADAGGQADDRNDFTGRNSGFGVSD